MSSGRNSGGQEPVFNFMFFIGIFVAFNIFPPLGILLLLWKLGVFKKVASSKIGSDSNQSLRMEKYRIISRDRNAVAIDYLASAVGVSYDTALRDLQRMVAEGQLGSKAYINYVDRTVILNPAGSRSSSGSTSQNAAQSFNGNAAHNYNQNTTRNAAGASPSAASQAKNRPSGGAEGSNMVSRAADSDAKKRGAQASADSSAPGSHPYRSLRILMLAAGLLLIVFGVVRMANPVDLFLSMGFDASLRQLIPGVLMAGSGAGCLAYRGFLKKRENRFKLYEAACAGRDFAPIEELASKAGVSERKCKKDLEAMLEKGLLPKTAYIDQGGGVLILKPGASPKAAREPEPEEDNEDRYKAILRQIRKLNDDIPDEDVSRRIDEMEDLTGRIFRAVQDKPEKESQIKSFMSYYLPTTLKLLSSYAEFERSGAEGDNISSAKAEIERILDTLVDGFKKQLDKLYESEAMDISSDIDVLETMLRRDGLTGDGSTFQTKKK